MKIGVIQASTRTSINDLLFQSVQRAVKGQHDVVNLGVFPDETETYSYVEVAVMISLLIETQSLDFVVTGCSSGQGMMMACNSLPGLRCGFVQTPQDAYLFGRITSCHAFICRTRDNSYLHHLSRRQSRVPDYHHHCFCTAMSDYLFFAA